MLNWANRFNIFCLLDNCGIEAKDGIEWTLAADASETFTVNGAEDFTHLDDFLKSQSAPVFGHVCYEAAGILAHKLPVKKQQGFPLLSFFSPEYLLSCTGNKLTIISSSEDVFFQILKTEIPVNDSSNVPKLIPALTREGYIKKVKQIQQHIYLGDCYELNYCIKQEAIYKTLDVVSCYESLVTLSPVPFAVLYKYENDYCICASPERYIKKDGPNIISQPIKGTAPRDKKNADVDKQQKETLATSLKNKTENVMTVDLVRNDLSRVCVPGSVQVKDLYAVHSFATVHQMISTVTGILKEQTTFTDLLNASFPMGSMTGAPKQKVMELIKEYETEPRGLFSGSIGYINPNADLDFNVVIRSIFYNTTTGELSSYAGGAITAESVAEEEWEEIKVKLSAIKEILSKN